MNTQLKIMLLKGAPASGKSSFCHELMRKDPGVWKRINNDALRHAIDLDVYSAENEKIIHSLRNHMLKEFLRKGYSVVIDNVNAGSRHFKEICEIVSKLNIDAQVFEKHFYVPLDELIARDSKRVGNAKVGEDVVKKFFGKLGGNQFKFYKVQHEVFSKRTATVEGHWAPMQQNKDLPKCVIYDLDGSMCLISHRNPYDASRCIDDTPHEHVVELCKLHHDNGHKIFFFSGREDKHRAMTEEWLNTYFGYPYELYMRETDNFEDDVKLKERLFNTHVNNKYNCRAWVDDRGKVCKWVYDNNLPLFRVNDPCSDF